MKRKVGILITSLAGGGAERVVSILLNELKNDYDITLVLMNETIVYEIPTDINIEYLENVDLNESSIKKIIKLPYLGWKYKTLSKQKGFDASLSFMYRPNFINIFAKFFGMKSKCIISERNTASQTYKGNSLSAYIGKFLVKNLYPKADLVIPNSHGNAEDLVQNFAVDSKKIKVIQNPVDIDKIHQMSEEEVWDISFKDKFTFISVARLDKHKNHDITIKAYAQIASSENQLLILGQGDQKEYLESLINEINLENNVKLLGFQKNPYKYMSKSDCFILSSNREGFPNVLVEALACGLSVISTDCKSGPREIIENNNCGLLYPVENIDDLVKKMKYFLCHNFVREEIQIIEKFKMVNILNKFRKVLNK